MIDLSSISTNSKALYLAYDQGLEHGPTDFNDENVNPSYILDIAVKGRYNGIILQKGVAEKYYTGSEVVHAVPLVLKLNGKTSLVSGEPFSPLICTVSEAIGLGAQAVGYTVYVGSGRQDEMFEVFGGIVREAHEKSIPVIGWMYPRGGTVKEETPGITSYAARIGLELGADIVKVKYHDSLSALKEIVAAAGRTRVVFSGGPKVGQDEFLAMVRAVADSGALGIAVGRNVWQSKDPPGLTKEIQHLLGLDLFGTTQENER